MRSQNGWSAHTLTTYLKLRQREILPQTRPRSIHKGEHVSMSLNFFRLGRYPTLTVCVLEPSTWSKDFSILTPNCGGTVHGCHRNHNQSTFGDVQAVDRLAGFRANGFGERDDIIFVCLWNNPTYTMNEGWREVGGDIPGV